MGLACAGRLGEENTACRCYCRQTAAYHKAAAAWLTAPTTAVMPNGCHAGPTAAVLHFFLLNRLLFFKSETGK